MSIKDFLLTEADDKVFDKLILNIEDATDNNEHTNALLILAQHLKDKRAVKILQGINTIHDAYGSMPSTLGKFREQIGEELFAHAKQKLEKSQFTRVLGAY